MKSRTEAPLYAVGMAPLLAAALWLHRASRANQRKLNKEKNNDARQSIQRTVARLERHHNAVCDLIDARIGAN